MLREHKGDPQNSYVSFGIENGITMLELGIGSGCVSISLLLTLESANIIGTDSSNEAILIANKNDQIHSVSNKLKIQ